MGATLYEIRVREHLDADWASWFEGMSIEHAPDGSTLIVGEIVDQAALQGILARINRLGLQLISVQPR
jgi:hypothetical protein